MNSILFFHILPQYHTKIYEDLKVLAVEQDEIIILRVRKTGLILSLDNHCREIIS